MQISTARDINEKSYPQQLESSVSIHPTFNSRIYLRPVVPPPPGATALPPTHMPRENADATRNAIAVRTLPADIVIPGGPIPLVDPLPRWKCCLRCRDYQLPQQFTGHRSLPHGRNCSRVLLRQIPGGISDQWPVVKSRP